MTKTKKNVMIVVALLATIVALTGAASVAVSSASSASSARIEVISIVYMREGVGIISCSEHHVEEANVHQLVETVGRWMKRVDRPMVFLQVRTCRELGRLLGTLRGTHVCTGAQVDLVGDAVARMDTYHHGDMSPQQRHDAVETCRSAGGTWTRE